MLVRSRSYKFLLNFGFCGFFLDRLNYLGQDGVSFLVCSWKYCLVVQPFKIIWLISIVRRVKNWKYTRKNSWTKINIIHHYQMFSGDRKIPTRGSTVPVGNEACRVSHWNGGPEGWDFPVNTEHKWSILLRMIPSLCLNMKLREVKERNKNLSKDKQFWYQNVSYVLTKKTHTHTWYFSSSVFLTYHHRIGLRNTFLTEHGNAEVN